MNELTFIDITHEQANNQDMLLWLVNTFEKDSWHLDIRRHLVSWGDYVELMKATGQPREGFEPHISSIPELSAMWLSRAYVAFKSVDDAALFKLTWC